MEDGESERHLQDAMEEILVAREGESLGEGGRGSPEVAFDEGGVLAERCVDEGESGGFFQVFEQGLCGSELFGIGGETRQGGEGLGLLGTEALGLKLGENRSTGVELEQAELLNGVSEALLGGHHGLGSGWRTEQRLGLIAEEEGLQHGGFTFRQALVQIAKAQSLTAGQVRILRMQKTHAPIQPQQLLLPLRALALDHGLGGIALPELALHAEEPSIRQLDEQLTGPLKIACKNRLFTASRLLQALGFAGHRRPGQQCAYNHHCRK